LPNRISAKIYHYDNFTNGAPVTEDDSTNAGQPNIYAPVWQQSPAPQDPRIINFDLFSHPVFARVYGGVFENGKPALSEVLPLDFLYGGANITDIAEHPHSFLMYPIFSTFNHTDGDNMIGVFVAVLSWDMFFSDLLSTNVHGIDMVLKSTCGDLITYRLDGPVATYVGAGDFHSHKHDSMESVIDFAPSHDNSNRPEGLDDCKYSLCIYSTDQLEGDYHTNFPVMYASFVVCVFIVTAGYFLLYDYYVMIRQDKLMATARQTSKYHVPLNAFAVHSFLK
jgi:hypothetical protein